MIRDLIQNAKQALTTKRLEFQSTEAQLEGEAVILQRLQVLEQKVSDGRSAFEAFRTIFDGYCTNDADIGEWFSSELAKLPGSGIEPIAALMIQVAANDAAKAHQAEILAGCQRTWVSRPEADMSAYKKANAAILKKYQVAV